MARKAAKHTETAEPRWASLAAACEYAGTCPNTPCATGYAAASCPPTASAPACYRSTERPRRPTPSGARRLHPPHRVTWRAHARARGRPTQPRRGPGQGGTLARRSNGEPERRLEHTRRRGRPVSLEATRWAWTVPGLTTAQRVVLLRLADRARSDGRAWPSVAALADECGLGKNRVPGGRYTTSRRGVWSRSTDAGARQYLRRARNPSPPVGLADLEPLTSRGVEPSTPHLPRGNPSRGEVLTPHEANPNQPITNQRTNQEPKTVKASARPQGNRWPSS